MVDEDLVLQWIGPPPKRGSMIPSDDEARAWDEAWLNPSPRAFEEEIAANRAMPVGPPATSCATKRQQMFLATSAAILLAIMVLVMCAAMAAAH